MVKKLNFELLLNLLLSTIFFSTVIMNVSFFMPLNIYNLFIYYGNNIIMTQELTSIIFLMVLTYLSWIWCFASWKGYIKKQRLDINQSDVQLPTKKEDSSL